MKPQDLRLGNYVHPASGISFPEHADGFVIPVVGKLAYLKIIAISQESVTAECPFSGKVFVKEVSPEEITPIPLTEELLLKCGFEKYRRGDVYSVRLPTTDMIDICIDLSNDKTVLFGAGVPNLGCTKS